MTFLQAFFFFSSQASSSSSFFFFVGGGGGREGGIGESRNFADEERHYAGANWVFSRILYFF